ncbi:MAG: hypothetical protein AAGC60_20040 [Acidobacteriota bacterium]
MTASPNCPRVLTLALALALPCAMALGVALTVLPTAARAQSWTQCAVEHSSACAAPSGAHITMRYGEQGNYLYSEATNLSSIPCSNAQLGDPLYGIAKRCELQVTAPPVGPFTHCANEHQQCNPGGGDNPRWVRYGAGDRWYYSIESNAFWCDNGHHNYDPIYGVVKSCQVGPPVIDVPNGAAVPWIHCAQAGGGTCAVPNASKKAWIRYGFDDRWTYRRFSGTSLACNLGSFGVDPFPYQLKVCEIYQEPDTPDIVCPDGQLRSGAYCLEPWHAVDLPADTPIAIRTTRVNRNYYGGSDVWQRFYGEIDGRFDAVDAELQPRNIFRIETFSDSCCAYSFPWYRLEAHDGRFVQRVGDASGRLGFGTSEDSATLFARAKTWVNGAYVPQAFSLAGAYSWGQRFDFLAQRNFYAICESPFNVGYGPLETLSPVISQWLSGPAPNYGCYVSGAHEFFLVHEP